MENKFQVSYEESIRDIQKNMMAHPIAGSPTLSRQAVHENSGNSLPSTYTSEPKHKIKVYHTCVAIYIKKNYHHAKITITVLNALVI